MISLIPWISILSAVLTIYFFVMGNPYGGAKKHYYYIASFFFGITIFGFIIALSSLFSYDPNSTWTNMFIGYDFTYNNFGYFFFLIMSFITLFDVMLAKPAVTFDKTPEAFTNRVEVAGLYWHFVDLVWIFLFPSIYLL